MPYDPTTANCYPNSAVLINKLGIRDDRTLMQAESYYSAMRLMELENGIKFEMWILTFIYPFTNICFRIYMIGQVRYVPQIFPKRGLVSALMNLSVKQGTLFFISLNIIIIIKMFQSRSFQAVLLSFLIVSIFFTLSEKAMEGLKKLLYPHYLKTLDIVLTFIIATRII